MKRAKRGKRGLIVTAAVCAVSTAAFVLGISGVSGSVGAQQTQMLQRAIERAVVTCYAIEGQYPPTLDYIRENYGVVIDEARFDVYYDAFAQNVMPSVSVTRREDAP